ncbi:MAG TPA: hypothetical protein VGD71_25730 [Kribbella sp.]
MVVTKGRYDVTSPGRDVGRFGRWVAEYRRNHGGFTVEIVDLAEVALPVLDEPQHPETSAYEKERTRDFPRPSIGRTPTSWCCPSTTAGIPRR